MLASVSVDFFNALSLWLTVLLAYIRCRCLKDPFNAHNFHTSKRVAIYVIFILAFTIITHLPSTFLFEFSSITSSDPATNTTEQMCVIKESNLIFHNSSIGRKIQFCAETVLDSIVPCFILVYLDFVILLTLKEASISRSSLRRNNTNIEIDENNETSRGRIQKHNHMVKGNSFLRLFKGENQESGHQLNETTTVNIKANTNRKYVKQHKEKLELENISQSCKTKDGASGKRKLFGKTKTRSVDSAFDRLDRESRRTSWLIFMVATIISLHEIPLAVCNVYVLVKHAGASLPFNVYGCLSAILLLWQYVTYLVIFLIYAFMSGAFRSELKRILGKLCGIDTARSAGNQKVFLSPCSVRKTISRDRDASLIPTHESDSEI
jgi:hypothetical protein